ncbi:MAG: hypothetical protein K2K31_03710 [Clostridia bacterium]|nr:hypothetical protein [Clostridia bacterium]
MTKISGLISIARKGGFVIIGQDNLRGYRKKLFLVLVDKSAGNSLMREAKFLSESKNIPLLEIDNLSETVGIENCKIVAVKNKSLSDSIIKTLKGE